MDNNTFPPRRRTQSLLVQLRRGKLPFCPFQDFYIENFLNIIIFQARIFFTCGESNFVYYFDFGNESGRGRVTQPLCQVGTYTRNAKNYLHFGISIAICTFWSLRIRLKRISTLDTFF